MPHPSNWSSRDALEDAVLTFIVQQGLTQWSLRSLADHLGVSTYTLTYHFGSKEQLLGVILARFETQMQAMMQTWALETGMTTSMLLRRFWEWLLVPERTSLGQTFFDIYAQALRHPEQFAQLLASGFPAWNTMLQQRLEKDGLPQSSSVVVASILVSSVTGLYLDWLTLHDTTRTTQAVTYLCQWVDTLLRQ